MDAFVIVISDNDISTHGYKRLLESSHEVGNDFEIVKFEAITPPAVDFFMVDENLTWNYPLSGSELDARTNLVKRAYEGKDVTKRISCAASHYMLWKYCVYINEPILILEHDAMFIRKLDYDSILNSNYGVVGINDPRNATFAYNKYHDLIQGGGDELQPPPVLVNPSIPQGLAGNSAYIIKPFAAKHLIDLCNTYGLWPNDAIMCHQLCDFLAVCRTYYTQVQGLTSTTTY